MRSNDIVDGELQFASYFKDAGHRKPSLKTAIAHNGSLVPGYRAATSWSRPGTRAAFPSSISPTPIARSRSPILTAGRSMPNELVTGGFWSTYWYRGFI